MKVNFNSDKGDAKRLLEQAFQIDVQLGTPTVYLHTDVFLEESNTEEDLAVRLDQIFDEVLTMDVLANTSSEDKARMKAWMEGDVVASNIMAIKDGSDSGDAMCYVLEAQGFPDEAHCYAKEEYQSPLINVVQMPTNALNGNDILEFALELKFNEFDTLTPLLRAHNIEHEIAHGTGAAEASSDMMAAVKCRQQFDENAGRGFLDFWADLRALELVFNYHVSKNGALHIDEYPWAMVEVNDAIATMPKSVVDGITEEQRLDMRFQSYSSLNEAILMVGEAMGAAPRAQLISQLHDTPQVFDLLVQTVDNVCKEEDLNETETRIIQRFKLACQRFSIGMAAYDGTHDFSDNPLAESQKERPMTFDIDAYTYS